jgi:hypothetical protein
MSFAGGGNENDREGMRMTDMGMRTVATDPNNN